MYKLFFVILAFLITNSFSQGHPGHSQREADPRHSVFGPERPTVWEFQLGSWSYDNEIASAFNVYSKNQRNKTFFMRYTNNGLDNRNLFQVNQLTGGIKLFPYLDDDRFQIEFGGTYDAINDTSLNNKSAYSRITFRPLKSLWFRVGYESMNGYVSGHSEPYEKTKDYSTYFVGKFENSRFALIGLTGTGEIDYDPRTRYGGAAVLKGPFNSYFLGGYIKSDNTSENVRTLAIGRWAPFRPDGLPSGFFIWKHKENYDFQLGGIFWGGSNLFVRPAALGMTQGIFMSSMALRDNSSLRQGQLMTITDDYRNSDISLFYVFLNQAIEMIPGNINHVGFKVIQLYKVFSNIKFSVVSKPVAGVFYNEETEPEFNPMVRSFKDKTTKFFTYQMGATFFDRFILNAISSPGKSEWNVALSYVYH